MMLDKKEILERTNKGLDVFRYYLKLDFKIGKPFKNPWYDDTKASCYIYFDKGSNQYKLNDFGNIEYSGDCFSIVGKLNLLDCKNTSDFKQIISIINSELFSSQSIPNFIPLTTNEPIPATSLNQVQKEILVENGKFTIKEFSSDEVAFWSLYGIDKITLERFQVVSIHQINGVNKEGKSYKILSYKAEPIFGYQSNKYIKIYRPNSKLRFLYLGEKPLNYIFGLEQLPLRGDLLFITGGEKDVISLSAHGFNAISLNSETSNLPESIMESLRFRFKHLILLYDCDKTGISCMERLVKEHKKLQLIKLVLPLKGIKEEKDISDFFKLGFTAKDLLALFKDSLFDKYESSISIMNTCEIRFDSPPEVPKALIKIKNVVIGSVGNIVCVTGAEGSGKSNFLGGMISGAIANEDAEIDTLGTTIEHNEEGKVVLLFDTEQSEYQLYKNVGQIVIRSEQNEPPIWFKAFCLVGISRLERLKLIIETIDRFYYEFGGIYLVVIDGIADLLSGVNDEETSVQLVEELFRLSAIYKTVIMTVLHISPSGFKLRGHLGSELQRKSAGILLVEKDDSENFSIVKAMKVRDGSPFDVPTIKFGWNDELKSHSYLGEISKTAKKQQKLNDLKEFVSELFQNSEFVSKKDIINHLISGLNVQERTAKKYISLLIDGEILVESSQFPGDLMLKTGIF